MKLDTNQQTFFELMRAGLWENSVKFIGESLKLIESLDWEEVYKLAEEQSVLGLVLTGIDLLPYEQKPPKVLLLQWIGEVQIIEQQNKVMNEFVAGLIEMLRNQDVYAILAKGQGIAQCYERPLWRSSGDVDLLLSEQNYEKAKTVLKPVALDVEREYKSIKHLGMTMEGGFVVELHGTLHSCLSKRIDKEIDEVQLDVFYGGNVREWNNKGLIIFLPSPDNDVIFVFTHILHHFFIDGIGLRQICDWCRLLWTYRDSLDRGLLEKRIQKMGLMTVWKAFAAFCVKYLGMPVDAMPFYSSDRTWDKKADRICSFIMEVGNLGHNRDTSFYGKYPYIIRKVISLVRRLGDLLRHATIFPLDSMRIFPYMMFNGLKSVVKGES